MIPVANFSSVSLGSFLVLLPPLQILDDPNCGQLFSCRKKITPASFGSRVLPAHVVVTHSFFFSCDYGCMQFSAASWLVYKTYCFAMMDSNIPIPACEMTNYVFVDSSRSPWEFRWTWCGGVVRLVDNSMLFTSLLMTAYNTLLFQGHIWTPYWQSLRWTWQVMPHLRHLD